jgi:hypothetical protein
LPAVADDLVRLARARMVGTGKGPSKPDDFTVILYRQPRPRRTRV